MAQPVAAPGEAGRPVGGLPTAAPRTFPPPSPLLGAWGAKSPRSVPVPGMLLVPFDRAAAARYFGAKNGQGTFLRVDLEQVSFGSLLGEEGRL